MKILKPTRNDTSHYNIAVPARELFEVQAASKREKTEIKKESEAPRISKIKYALHIQPCMCFNARVNRLKKNP